MVNPDRPLIAIDAGRGLVREIVDPRGALSLAVREGNILHHLQCHRIDAVGWNDISWEGIAYEPEPPGPGRVVRGS